MLFPVLFFFLVLVPLVLVPSAGAPQPSSDFFWAGDGATPDWPVPECAAGDAKRFLARSKLSVIVTGMMNSGTTVLSDLIMNAPGVLGAFECGVLLPRHPRDLDTIHPFFEWLSGPPKQLMWGVDKKKLQRVIKTATCHADVYAALYDLSPFINKTYLIVDKTPAYTWILRSVMRRAPGVPVVVVSKKREDQLASWGKRGIRDEGQLDLRYDQGVAEIDAALKQHPDRIVHVTYDELTENTNTTMERVFDFLHLGPWLPEYATMDSLNAKYAAINARLARPFLPPPKNKDAPTIISQGAQPPGAQPPQAQRAAAGERRNNNNNKPPSSGDSSRH